MAGVSGGDTLYKEVWMTVYSVQSKSRLFGPKIYMVYTVYMRLDLILMLALLLFCVSGLSVTSQRQDLI